MPKKSFIPVRSPNKPAFKSGSDQVIIKNAGVSETDDPPNNLSAVDPFEVEEGSTSIIDPSPFEAPNEVQDEVIFDKIKKCFKRITSGAVNNNNPIDDERSPLLPRPVPGPGNDETPPSWWDYIPKPIQQFLKYYKWYLLGLILILTVIVVIVLAATGNYMFIPGVLKLSFCFVLSTFFGSFCGAGNNEQACLLSK